MSTIDLQTLTQALEQVKKEVGYKEKEYRVGDHLRITLCSLPATVEVIVQKEAKAAIDVGDGEDPATFVDYVDRLRAGTLSRCIVGVNDTFFREEKVFTGEYIKTPKGDRKPVTEPRHIVVRKIIEGWPRNLIITLFECFDELMGEIETEVSKHIKFDPIKIEKEVERLEHRITELKDRRMKIVQGRQPDFVEQQRKAAVREGKARTSADAEQVAEVMYKTAIDKKRAASGSREELYAEEEELYAGEEEEEYAEPEQPPVSAAPVQRMSPPLRRPPQAHAPVQAAPAQPAEYAPPPRHPRDAPAPRRDSMIDWDNPDAAIAAENRRLMAERNARFQAQVETQGGFQQVTHDLAPQPAARQPIRPRPRPPHVSAAQIANRALQQHSMTEEQAFEQRDAIIEGGQEVPVFSMQGGSLERTPPKDSNRPVTNPAPDQKGTRNPNFVSPRNRR